MQEQQGTTWTYNQGVVLGGLSDLYAATHARTYLDLAEGIADAVISSTLVDAHGILTEPCENGDCGNDGPQFKGIFIRNLAYLSTFNAKPAYVTFIQNNALSILRNNRSLSNQLGLHWSGPFDKADSTRQSSALDALNAAMRVNSVG